MTEEVQELLNSLDGQDEVYLSYLDPSPSSPMNQGGGSLLVCFGKKTPAVGNLKSRKYQMQVGASATADDLYDVFRAACRTCKIVYVDDLHHFLLRSACTPRNRPPRIVDVTDPMDGSGGAYVCDVSYARSWIGLETEGSPVDLAAKAKEDVLQWCGSVFDKVSKKGIWYYYLYYIPILREYAWREVQTIHLWSKSSGRFVKRWVQYEFHSIRTGRLVTKGSDDDSAECFGAHFVNKSHRPTYLKARPGHKIVMLDCKGADVSLGACMSGDETLLDLLRNDGDPYGHIGDRVPGGPHDRSKIKRIVIAGFANGASVGKLVDDTDMDGELVRAVLDECEKTYSKLNAWIRWLVNGSRESGVVRTPTGREISVPKDRARTVAPSVMMQATNADLNTATYASMIKACREERPWITPLVHIHDGYVLEVPCDNVDDDVEFLVACATKVPITAKELRGLVVKVHCEVGDTWR